MDEKIRLLAKDAPAFFESEGHFFVDVGIENAPLLAYSPHLFLKAIRRAQGAYMQWSGKDGSVVDLCGCGPR